MASIHRRSRTEWQEILEEYRASGVSARQYCTDKGLGYASFLNWRKRLADDLTTDPVSSLIDLSSLTENTGSSSWHIELDLGEGMVLRLDRR